jgi:hypothetical protein
MSQTPQTEAEESRFINGGPGRVYACMKQWDANGDGKLSLPELEAALGRSGILTSQGLIEKVVADIHQHNGSVSTKTAVKLEEFEQYVSHIAPLRPEQKHYQTVNALSRSLTWWCIFGFFAAGFLNVGKVSDPHRLATSAATCQCKENPDFL